MIALPPPNPSSESTVKTSARRVRFTRRRTRNEQRHDERCVRIERHRRDDRQDRKARQDGGCERRLQAINSAYHTIAAGVNDIVIAGGPPHYSSAAARPHSGAAGHQWRASSPRRSASGPKSWASDRSERSAKRSSART